jgi:hypothetical protein
MPTPASAHIDVSAALALPGVKAVITGATCPPWRDGAIEGGEGGGDYADIAVNVMARDKALYEGHAVAAVAATTLAQAQCGRSRPSIVDYDVLSRCSTSTAAMAPGCAAARRTPLFTEGLDEAADGASNVAQRLVQARGWRPTRPASPRRTWSWRATFHTPTRAPGLHRTARLRRPRRGQDGKACSGTARRAHFDDRTNVGADPQHARRRT